MKKNNASSKKPKGLVFVHSGFTLIELLIVIIIIASLAVVVFVALNPVKRLMDARNSRRLTDVDSIRSAINTYAVDKGSLPPGLSAGMAETQIGTGGSAPPCGDVWTGDCNVAPGTACIDLSGPLSSYLKSMPVDPLSGTAAQTLYSVSIDAISNTVTVNACGKEGNLVQNGSFENTGAGWLNPWWFNVYPLAGGTISQDNSTKEDGLDSAHILVTTANANWWYVQLGQNFSLTTKPYTVSFWAKASATHPMFVSVQQNYSPWTAYSTQTFNLTTSWQQYTFTFTLPQADANTTINFDVAQVTGDVWIDRVSLY